MLLKAGADTSVKQFGIMTLDQCTDDLVIKELIESYEYPDLSFSKEPEWN